jgi:hypothetical protein
LNHDRVRGGLLQERLASILDHGERDDLSDQEKRAVLADNAKRFFKL